VLRDEIKHEVSTMNLIHIILFKGPIAPFHCFYHAKHAVFVSRVATFYYIWFSQPKQKFKFDEEKVKSLLQTSKFLYQSSGNSKCLENWFT
jgi:hypothetical protein